MTTKQTLNALIKKLNEEEILHFVRWNSKEDFRVIINTTTFYQNSIMIDFCDNNGIAQIFMSREENTDNIKKMLQMKA